MSKINEAKMASLNDKIYNDAVEQEKKKELKPRRRLILKQRGSSRTSKRKGK